MTSKGYCRSALSVVFILYYCKLVLSNSNEANEPCNTMNGREGICILYTECDVLRNTILFDRLFAYQCGIEDDEPKVCCPVVDEYAKKTTEAIVGRSGPLRKRERPSSPPAKSPLLPEDCGIKKSAMAKIVGGTVADVGAWPWIAAIYFKLYGYWETSCGGALITSKHVITAAHCLIDSRGKPLLAKNIRVRLGEHDLEREDDGASPVDIDLLSFTSHEGYVRRTYLNDIAILNLAKEVPFSAQVLPVCLPFDELYNDDLTGLEATVIGWGTTDFKGPPSDILLEAEITVVTNEECKIAYKKEVPITDVYLCAGSEDGSTDACRGDSGGPLVTSASDYRYYLIGIVSFGKKCATPGYPGVYTRVTEFLGWINDQLE